MFKYCMVCLENRLTKNIWTNSFTVFKTFQKWYSNFNFREATSIAFVLDSYKKIETNSGSLNIIKSLLDHLK